MRVKLDELVRLSTPVSRRALLQIGGALAVSAWAGDAPAAEAASRAQARPDPKLEDEAEQPWPPEHRIRWCAVGLGKLALDQVLPAFGACKKARLTALVSGDRGKAERVAQQYWRGAEEYLQLRQLRRSRQRRADRCHIHHAAEFLTRGIYGARRERWQARALREADGDIDTGLRANDPGMQERQSQADDRVSVPLRALQSRSRQPDP
jgi:hypothetical protein